MVEPLDEPVVSSRLDGLSTRLLEGVPQPEKHSKNTKSNAMIFFIINSRQFCFLHPFNFTTYAARYQVKKEFIYFFVAVLKGNGGKGG